MNELKLKYETEKKEKEIELLNEKTKRQKLQKRIRSIKKQKDDGFGTPIVGLDNCDNILKLTLKK